MIESHGLKEAAKKLIVLAELESEIDILQDACKEYVEQVEKLLEAANGFQKNHGVQYDRERLLTLIQWTFSAVRNLEAAIAQSGSTAEDIIHLIRQSLRAADILQGNLKESGATASPTPTRSRSQSSVYVPLQATPTSRRNTAASLRHQRNGSYHAPRSDKLDMTEPVPLQRRPSALSSLGSTAAPIAPERSNSNFSSISELNQSNINTGANPELQKFHDHVTASFQRAAMLRARLQQYEVAYLNDIIFDLHEIQRFYGDIQTGIQANVKMLVESQLQPERRVAAELQRKCDQYAKDLSFVRQNLNELLRENTMLKQQAASSNNVHKDKDILEPKFSEIQSPPVIELDHPAQDDDVYRMDMLSINDSDTKAANLDLVAIRVEETLKHIQSRQPLTTYRVPSGLSSTTSSYRKLPQVRNAILQLTHD